MGVGGLGVVLSFLALSVSFFGLFLPLSVPVEDFVDLENGLVVWCPCDYTLLNKYYDNDLRNTNGVFTSVGYYHYGIECNGVNAYYRLNPHTSLDKFSAFSVCLWFYPHSITQGQITNKGWGSDGSILAYISGGSRLYFYVDQPSGVLVTDSYVFPSNNTWYFLVFEFEREEPLRVYVNDTLVSEDDVDTYDEELSLSANWYFSSSGGYVDGVFDEIRIYNRVLSESERYWLFHSLE